MMKEFLFNNIYIIVGLLFIALFIFAYLLVGKSRKLKQVQLAVLKLKQSFNDLDEQAKLIVKTDLELNRTQEELDKRLDGLEALQIISKSISTTLDENQIFEILSETLKGELSFEKISIFTYNEDKHFDVRINYGFTEEIINEIAQNLEKDEILIPSLKENKTYSSFSATKAFKDSIKSAFAIDHFIISPINVRNKMGGIIFVGNQSNTLPISGGDEEIISIMANQIGQSLENAALFEQVYASSQDLESKVIDRTRQLEEALREVKNMSKTKSEFISAVSHELRTPLTSIKGYASILMAGKLGDVPDQVKKRLEKINKHSDNLVNLINDLLDISRIESGRIEMNIKKCNIKKIIDAVQDLLTPQMRDKNIKCVVDVNDKIPEIEVDSNQVERVFINLAGNATKFTPENGTITIKAKPVQNDMVKFEVIDTGIGIPEKDIVKLFDEFYRADNKINEHVKGTGLGLPLAKKIILAHHGEIWITSKVNEGTTFHFTLPLVQPAQNE